MQNMAIQNMALFFSFFLKKILPEKILLCMHLLVGLVKRRRPLSKGYILLHFSVFAFVIGWTS
jgi:hypothetical protein